MYKKPSIHVDLIGTLVHPYLDGDTPRWFADRALVTVLKERSEAGHPLVFLTDAESHFNLIAFHAGVQEPALVGQLPLRSKEGLRGQTVDILISNTDAEDTMVRHGLRCAHLVQCDTSGGRHADLQTLRCALDAACTAIDARETSFRRQLEVARRSHPQV
jgi:hypothetical protein